MVSKIIIALAAVAVIVTLGAYGMNSFIEGVRAGAYADGVSDTNAEALRLAEKRRLAEQTKIDKIATDAEAQIAARTATNVEKAIADVRKTNPDCSLTVPRSVLDELRRNK